MKGVFQNRLHERATLHINHAHFAFRSLQDNPTSARCALRIIYRTQKARLRSNKCNDVFLVPNVIARGYDRDAGPQEIDRDFSSYAATAGRVFAVNYDKIGAILCLQLGKPGNDRAAAWLANDVTQEKNC